jgi:hypothetical protein
VEGAQDALARLSVSLGGLGFRVVLVDDTRDVIERLSQAVSLAGSGDDLLVHLSGRLSGPGELRAAAGLPLPLQAIGDLLSSHARGQISIVAELVCDDGAPSAAQHVESVVWALGARERGYTVLAAVRPLSFTAEELGFTSLVLKVAKDGGEARLSAVYRRTAELADAQLLAQSHALVPGRADVLLAAPEPVQDLDALIAAATDSRSWHRVVELRRERLKSHSASRARVRELVAIARVQQAELGEAENAIESLEQARAIDASRVPVLQALRRGYETLGRWASAIEIAGVLGDLAPSPLERAAIRFAQARMALDHLQDEDRAAVWLEQAIDDDPSHVDARNALALLRTVAATPDMMVYGATVLPPVVDGPTVAPSVAPPVTPPPPAALEAAVEPARGPAFEAAREAAYEPAREAAFEPARAPAFEPAPEAAVGAAPEPAQPAPDPAPEPSFVRPAMPLEPALEYETSAFAATAAPVPLLPSEPPPPAAASPAGVEVHGAAEAEDFDELNPVIYARAFATSEHEGRTDAAFLAALSLEALGAAQAEHRAVIDRTRTVAPLRARGTLDAPAWALLRPPESDDVLRDLFASVARAGTVVQTDQLASAGRLVALDPVTRLDGTSTASAVRSFQWAARVLGMPCPHLHAIDVVPGDISAVRRYEPTTAIGPSIMSGRSAKDLAFLAGRHLTYYLPEHQMLIYFPTREELTRLFLACIQVARPGLPTGGEAARAVAGLAERLGGRMTTQDRAALRHAVHRLEARGGRFSLSAFARHAELIAARAGLLLSGDLATALSIVRSESRAIAGVTLEAKARDLIAFSASAEHAALRERYAFTAPETHAATALRAS